LVLNIICTLTKNIIYVIGSNLAAKKVFNRLNKAIMFSNMRFFDNNPSGRIVNRISNDTFVTDFELPWYFNITLNYFSQIIGLSIGIIINLQWIAVSIVIVLIAVYYI
jgi:ATP-binding cassette, subfamily C (CFTR/MRP), member 10